jgi:hypothetical protein
MKFGGNPSLCMKTGMLEGHGCYRRLPTPILGIVLSFELAKSVLLSLGIATTCNAGRILMQDTA